MLSMLLINITTKYLIYQSILFILQSNYIFFCFIVLGFIYGLLLVGVIAEIF